MKDYFALLGFPQDLQISVEEVRRRFQDLSAMCHPDHRADAEAAERFKDLSEARRVLTRDSLKLQHWVALGTGEETSLRGELATELADLFEPLAELMQAVDAHLEKREATQSSLARALMESETQRMREGIQKAQHALQLQMAAEREKMPDYQAKGASEVAAMALTSARNLAFLEKWSAQLKERFARLF